MRTITVAERRARLGRRHHLAEGSRDAGLVDVAGDLVGLHATDAGSVFLAARARASGAVPATVETSLYEDRTLLRMLGMRRTVFVVPTVLLPTVHAACTAAIAAQERKRLVQLLEDVGIARDGGRWLTKVERATLRALDQAGEASATELSKVVPELALQIELSAGKPYAGKVGVSTRVLFVLAAEGRVVRGRPRGSWVSSQYRWAAVGTWLEGRVALPEEPTVEVARVDLVRRWLRTFGPATLGDIRWWTGWTVGETRRAVGQLDTVAVDLDGEVGLVLADDVDEVEPPGPWVALLPALDPTAMGWKARDWYLGGHEAALFDRSGNVGPTVWCDGRIVGGWAQRRDGEVVHRLLEDPGRRRVGQIEAEAASLQAWLGDVRVTPRFRTPLEKELWS